MLQFIVEKIAERIAGNPQSPRWAVITALFGWAGIAGLLAWIFAVLISAARFGEVAFGMFTFAFMIAFSMDWTRIIHTTAKGTRCRVSPESQPLAVAFDDALNSMALAVLKYGLDSQEAREAAEAARRLEAQLRERGESHLKT